MKSTAVSWLFQASFILSAGLINAQNYDFDSNVQIQLFHSLNPSLPEHFSSRGNISVLSINTGELVISQKELNQKEQNLLAELAKKDRFYRIKAEVVGSDGMKATFLTSSKACHLVHSQLNDVFTINFDHNSAMLGINHRPVNLEQVADSCASMSDSYFNELSEFSTVVTLKTIEQAPVPDTAGFIQKIEKEREARDRGETKDNRSFLSKYWMYIVPAVILLLISGVTNPEQGAAPGSQAAR